MDSQDLQDSTEEIIKYVNLCLLTKLSKDFDEYDNPVEYVIRENNLIKYFEPLIDLLKRYNMRNHSESTLFIISSLFILYQELRCGGPWNTEKCIEYSDKLSSTFDNICGVPLGCVLNRNEFNTQNVFDVLMLELHKKINSDFKKYPGLIEVYCSIIHNVKTYNIVLKPITVLPIPLLLIDDYINTNQIKGLKCCSSVLQCLDQKDFIGGNYYEVIYGYLQKTVVGKEDIEVTKLVQECLLELFRIIPSEVKDEKLDYTFSSILGQIYTESNLYRKAACFSFIKHMIQIHGINTVNKIMFKIIVCDSTQMCSNHAVAEILLADVLECLEIWLQHCWCTWRLSTDHKLLSGLFILLYECKKEKFVSQIHILIVTLISLCQEEEQKLICNHLEFCEISSHEFLQRLMLIKRDINM